jgi:hypothetical protein
MRDLFDSVAFGPDPGDSAIEVRPATRPPGELRRIWRWVRAHELPAQIVLALGFTAIASLALVFGLLIGAGIAPWVGG